MREIVFWIAMTVILAVIEAVTAGLVTVWFAVGAFASVIAAATGAKVSVQVLIFVLVSAITLALTRPFVKKVTKKQAEPTNADKAIGQICVVTEEIDNMSGIGAVMCLGKEWTARTADGSVVGKNEKVRVCRIEGVKLIVEPVLIKA